MREGQARRLPERSRRVKNTSMRSILFIVLIICTIGAQAAERPRSTRGFEMIPIPGGSFVMGDAQGNANEAPKQVSVKPFAIMKFEVTNAQFAAFVKATGYVTDVEKNNEGHVWTDKWHRILGADWRHPHGAASSIAGKYDHPVLQTSARDAAAFCRYYAMRLPREAEWEFAARGTDGRRWPWGFEAPRQAGVRKGNFGSMRCCKLDASDGYARTAPVGRFPAGASPYGVLDMAGNVWEWTASPFPGRPNDVSLRGGGWGNRAYCLRVSKRHWNPPNIGLDMVGFRCVKDAR